MKDYNCRFKVCEPDKFAFISGFVLVQHTDTGGKKVMRTNLEAESAQHMKGDSSQLLMAGEVAAKPLLKPQRRHYRSQACGI